MNPNATAPASTPPKRPASLVFIAQIVIILVIIGLIVGLLPRWIARHRLSTENHASSVMSVNVISPVPYKPDLGTPLPAEVQAFTQASIHARASGYLTNWFADIGTHVTNGQVLALIETPEIDQQLAQARAELDQALANQGLAKITADRWTELLKSSSVSDQETAEKQADYTLKQANVAAAQANVHRLEETSNFGRITAPFEGTITARNTDIGQLISANGGPELFRLAQTDPLRVYVRAPQALIYSIVPGQTAELTFQEQPGRIFAATVTRTAGAVDPASRTLQVELQVPNPKGEILAGSFAQVRFNEAVNTHGLTISDNALIFHAEGMQLALVDGNNVVHLRSIKLGRDFGNTVEVLSGLALEDRVIINPPDAIADGMTVQISAPPSTNSPAK
ncbi:MAG TPA: efflux RND transporter periplasmic adaptor subunit [Verrucomicrobiae bacterium]|nr:efflux RND transporter periplasmic adaptor subunit [Verrucomicrobiae bacterium]